MADSESARGKGAASLDSTAAGSIEDHTSQSNSSSQEVSEIFYNDLAQNWPGLPIQSPPRNISSRRDLAGHHNETLSTNPGFRSKFTIPEDLQGGSRHSSDTNNDAQEQLPLERPPAHLQPPHQALSPTLLQHPVAGERSVSPVIPLTNLWEFYNQRKEMIARHHWKLTNQDMTFSNAQRCIKMLMKHHWKLIDFMTNLEHEGNVDGELLDLLIRGHANLLDATGFVLNYFELCRISNLRL